MLKRDLENGRPVLFFETGCQVVGLRSLKKLALQSYNLRTFYYEYLYKSLPEMAIFLS